MTYRPAVSLHVATICYIKEDLLLGVKQKGEKHVLTCFNRQTECCGESRIIGQRVCAGEPGVHTD